MPTQEHLFETIPCNKYDLLSKDDVVTLHKEEEKIRIKIQKENEKLREQLNIVDQKSLLLGEQYVNLKNQVFGKSSEKSEPKKKRKKIKKEKERGSRAQLPSERYPNIPVVEQELELDSIPTCPCCSEDMADSGMWEISESLTVIPKKFQVLRQKRKKYCCNKCYGDIQTTPAPPRILSGSSYSDEMMLDASLSKFCDLIPMDRYTKIASRENLINLPPNSLINLTHHLADFFQGAVDKCKDEVTASKIIKADETKHKMLERKEDKESWYLWGFSSSKACYFEVQKTRSGDVASEFLKDSNCIYLMSDVFSGYNKAVRETNIYRKKKDDPLITKIYCNAHARRYFKRAEEKFPDEAAFFIKMYRRIYYLEGMVEKVLWEKKLRLRKMMKDYAFSRMEQKIIDIKNCYSNRSSISKGMNYFFNHYDEFTLCTTNPDLPLDNNAQEARFRSPVVGRKTWIGTHSRRGAQTTAAHFTLIESCKLIKVNPREYYKELAAALLRGENPFTPYEYKVQLEKNKIQHNPPFLK